MMSIQNLWILNSIVVESKSRELLYLNKDHVMRLYNMLILEPWIQTKTYKHKKIYNFLTNAYLCK